MAHYTATRFKVGARFSKEFSFPLHAVAYWVFLASYPVVIAGFSAAMKCNDVGRSGI